MKDWISKPWIKESVLLILFIALVVALAILRGLFGLNMKDEGWLLTAYQNIFSYPSSVSYNFLYYNGIVAGGVWNLFFGDHGIIAFRYMHVLLEVCKALLVYYMLRKYCNKYAIIIGFLLYEVIYDAYTFTDHNQLSAVLCLLAILFIAESLEKKNWLYMLMGGTIVGLNVFTRIPNLSLCALILVLVIYWLYTRDKKETLHLFIAAIGGFVVGCVAEILMMYSLGHLPIFIDNITSGFSASNDVDSTHNLMSMGQRYLGQLFDIWYQIALIVMMAISFRYAKRNVQSTNRIIYITIFIVLIVILAVATAYHQPKLWRAERLYVMLTLTCLYIIWRAPLALKYIATLSLIFIYMLPLGSDWGYHSSITYHAMCLAFPLSIAYLLAEIKHKRLHQQIAIIPVCLFAIVAIGYSTYKGGQRYIDDCRNFFIEQRDEVHSPLATTIFTGNYYSTRLNPLLDEMVKYVKPGDVVLCFQSMAMVHYLTETRPYLGNAWPWTYTSSDMERHFIKAQKESEILPVIVREKGWVLDVFNDENYMDWDNSEAVENHFHKNRKIRLIQDFIRENNYSLAWEDKAFQILLPPDEN